MNDEKILKGRRGSNDREKERRKVRQYRERDHRRRRDKIMK